MFYQDTNSLILIIFIEFCYNNVGKVGPWKIGKIIRILKR